MDALRRPTAPKVLKAPSSSAAWATAFISEVSSAAQVALQQAGPGNASRAPLESVSDDDDLTELQQELPRRSIGDAEDLAGEGVVFGGHGQVWEVCREGPSSLQAAAFSLR